MTSISCKSHRVSQDDASCLLVEHQDGLISLVQDVSPGECKNNILALAASARYFKLPTMLATSVANGRNSPLVQEMPAMCPDAPSMARPGNIHAWDNADVVNAVQKTERTQLLLAGVLTEVCVACPALSAVEAGSEVCIVPAASGTCNEVTRHPP